jgi:hypothetical protein
MASEDGGRSDHDEDAEDMFEGYRAIAAVPSVSPDQPLPDISPDFFLDAARFLASDQARERRVGRPTAVQLHIDNVGRQIIAEHPLPPLAPAHIVAALPAIRVRSSELCRIQLPIIVNTTTISPFKTTNLLDPIVAALAIVANGGDKLEKDADTQKLFNHFLLNPNQKLAITDLERMLDISRKKKSDCMIKFASSLYVMERIARLDVERTIAQHVAPRSLLLYSEFSRYDETPMWISLVGNALMIDAALDDPIVKVLANFLGPAFLSSRQDPSIAKLLQTRQQIVMVVKLEGSWVLIRGDPSCAVQVLERTTAKATISALLESSVATSLGNRFKFKKRSCCSDAHPSNLASERAIKRLRLGWNSTHTLCHTHGSALAHTKTFDLAPASVTGVVNTLLSIGNPLAKRVLIMCVKDEIASRFELVIGTPQLSEEAIAYKRFVLSCFFKDGANCAVRRALVCKAFPLDWRDWKIGYPVLEGQDLLDTRVYLGLVTTCVCLALLGRYPYQFNRSKWTGAELAWDFVGAMESLYRLYSTSMIRFVAWFSTPSGRVLGVFGALEDRPAALAIAADPLDGSGENDAAAAAAQGRLDEEKTYAEQNAKCRRKAFAYSQTDPLASLMQERIVMEPLRLHLHSKLYLGSSSFEKKQRVRVATAAARNLPTRGARDFRLQLVARGAMEAEFYVRLEHAFRVESMWAAIPRSNATFEFRAKSFRMLSRSGGSIEEYFCRRARLFPVPLYLLVHNDDEDTLQRVRVAASECEALLDPWTLELMAQYPTLCEEELLVILEADALEEHIDNSLLEVLHSKLRKELVARVQTHKADLPQISSLLFMRQSLEPRPSLARSLPNVKAKTKKASACIRIYCSLLYHRSGSEGCPEGLETIY